ncbi:MAG: hypothetical protein H6830_12885 [Planctomycetes bacterium]|nr:hypothetical protein [Planctomycetota bacterium]
MKGMLRFLRSVGAAWLGTVWLASAVLAQEPAVESVSLFRAIRVNPVTGEMRLGPFFGVFLPRDARTGPPEALPADKTCFAVLREADSRVELERWNLQSQPSDSVFTPLSPSEPSKPFAFSAGGAYELTVQIGNTTLAEVPLKVTRTPVGDPTQPSMHTCVSGPWAQLACLRLGDLSAPEGTPKILLWIHSDLDGNDPGISIEVRRSNRVVFQGDPIPSTHEDRSLEWKWIEAPLRFPKPEGGGLVRNRDLVQTDGTYEVRVLRAGQPMATYRLEVHANRVVPHPNQDFGFQPHAAYLCGRSPADRQQPAGNLFWMDRVADQESETGVATSRRPDVKAGSAAAWVQTPSTDANRPFQLHTTSMLTCAEAGIAVGEDLVVFGTGPERGVAYLRAGDDRLHALPNGDSWNSRMMAVCGQKIVLTRGHQVAVYDTSTGKLHALPDDQVWLSRSEVEFYGSWPLAADGFLVALLNDPDRVADQRKITVLDLSGELPKRYALQNPDAASRELHSIAVESTTRRVVVGWSEGQALWVGTVATDGELRAVPLGSRFSIRADSPLQMAGGRVAYIDDAPSPNLVVLDLADGSIQSVGAIGKVGRYFAITPSALAYMTDSRSGSSHRFVTGPFDAASTTPREASYGGDESPPDGTLGTGTSVAWASSECCFLAGHAQGGMGPAEPLQVGQARDWARVAGPDGQPLHAADVVAGPHMLAFKYLANGEIRVGYATYGAHLRAADIPRTDL